MKREMRLGYAFCVLAILLSIACANLDARAQTAVERPQSVSDKIAASKTLLDINTATDADLNALPGMGEAYVQRVIAARPYTAKNQLVTRGILPAAEYDRIKDRIIAHRPKK